MLFRSLAAGVVVVGTPELLLDDAILGKAAAAGRAPFTFRGDSRAPEVIFKEGFSARGESTDLLAHALDNTNPPSAFISTSSSFSVASGFSDRVYVISAEGGINVNAALGSSSPFPYEFEVAIPGAIGPGDVRGVTLVSEGMSILNPNWQP